MNDRRTTAERPPAGGHPPSRGYRHCYGVAGKGFFVGQTKQKPFYGGHPPSRGYRHCYGVAGKGFFVGQTKQKPFYGGHKGFINGSMK